jgi:hypothetical protein
MVCSQDVGSNARDFWFLFLESGSLYFFVLLQFNGSR